MKMQKSVRYAKKSLKINISKINNMVKSEIIVIIQGNREYEGAAHSICNLKYLVPKRIPRFS